MNWRKIVEGLVAVIVIGIFALLLIKTSLNLKTLKEEVYEQNIQIQANTKQIPVLTAYIKLVSELTEASKGQLSAFEIVEVSEIIIRESQLNRDIGLKPELIMAIMERESGFNPKAISPKRAYGLMQVTRTIFELHLPDLGYNKFTTSLALNPIVNVQVGIRELIRLKKYWMMEGIEGWMIPVNSYFWGISTTWELFLKKKRAMLPSLEYGKQVLELADSWKEKGL